MAAVRTQVYLTDDLRERIDRAAAATGQTMAEVIRSALDAYLTDDPDPSTALEETFGCDPHAATPSREEWARD